jgi:hypothetical protein
MSAAERGVKVCIQRAMLEALGIKLKKRPATPPTKSARVLRLRSKPGAPSHLSIDRLVFIDETWATTNMTRQHGRTVRGSRVENLAVPLSRAWIRRSATAASHCSETSSAQHPVPLVAMSARQDVINRSRYDTAKE